MYNKEESNIGSDDVNFRRETSSYPGDFVDPTATAIRSSGFVKLDFADPAEMLNFFDDNIQSGEVTLHKWQTELLESLAAAKPTSIHPHKFCLVASNGSGKDAFIVAPFVVWFALCKIQARVILTSSSGTQLTSQTEGYIRALAERVNAVMGEEVFRVRQRYIKCRLTGSEIRMFATDEAGKAEGYHPMIPNAEMAIVVNEGKTVTDEIHNALKRCTGFNYWVEVSSPGEPTGFFHRIATDERLRWIVKTVTSYDCPHISPDEIEVDKIEWGEHSLLFRSKHLALFTQLGGEVIITDEVTQKLLKMPPTFDASALGESIGIDIAAGGDENSLCFVKGNKVRKEYYFRETDTTITADRIEQILVGELISKDHDAIFADDGGVGHSVIDQLVRRGWNIKRVLNQWAAVNKKNYGNRGAENWYRVKRLVEERLIDVTNCSKKTIEQLTSRRYKQALLGAKIYLESKKEAKAHGRPSPDRADALVLAFTGKTIDLLIDARGTETTGYKGVKEGEEVFKTQEEIVQYYADKVTYSEYQPNKKRHIGKRVFNSLKSALNLNN